MAITQDSPTGFVNNLTATQDEKLRELWILLFNSIASVLSAVYDVQLPEGPPSKLFEVLDKINEPTVDAVVGALKGKNANAQPTNGATAEEANNGEENGENKEQNGEENKEQKSLDKMESLMNDEAKRTIISEIATREVSPEHFAAVFAQLRKMGVRDSEIKSMENILSKLTPGEMCFAVLKMIKQENPDSLLLRFLRARKWDVGKAYAMLTTNILWRTEMEVDDDIVPKGELHALEQSRNAKSSAKEKKDGHDFIEQLKTGKSFLHGFDKQGRPVNYVRVKIHKPGAQSEETLERYIVHVIESNRLLLDPPVETATVVFDMTGFSLSNMEYQPVKFIIKCFEANYPESLGLLLIHNAPWIFSGIWKLIHGWMDPVVASKVHFTRSVSDLDKFVSRDQIPKELAGDENWEYKYVEPENDENAVMQDTSACDCLMFERLMTGLRILAATGAWISATTFSKGKEDKAAVEELKSRRQAIIEDFRLNYWKLDPYVRARALIDRTGALKPDGTVVKKAETNGTAK
ncbi:CRAL TRIO domain protein [Aspergillus sp. HF37]|nr:CRAL TRIO domain protein [Aspergillus sp. HF37]